MAKHTPEAIAAECERRFQNGGPRVFTLEADGSLLPSGMSAAQAARSAFPDQTVLARQKRAGRYTWRAVAKATGEQA